LFSLPAWGCSVVEHRLIAPGAVLPTRVGMFRRRSYTGLGRSGSPHRHGDGPLFTQLMAKFVSFSPTCVGMARTIAP